MTKKMTEAQAWRECAEWVMAKPDRRYFLCHRLDTLYDEVKRYDSAPHRWPRAAMLGRIHEHMAPNYDTLDNDDEAVAGESGNDIRAMFCLLMALECEEESRGYVL